MLLDQAHFLLEVAQRFAVGKHETQHQRYHNQNDQHRRSAFGRTRGRGGDSPCPHLGLGCDWVRAAGPSLHEPMVNGIQNFVAPATKFCIQQFMVPMRYHLLGLEASHQTPRAEGGAPRRPYWHKWGLAELVPPKYGFMARE